MQIFKLFIGSLLCFSFLHAADQTNINAKELYQKCSKCHGKDGKHRAFDRSGVIAGQDAQNLINTIMSYKQAEFSNHSPSLIMSKQVLTLSTEQIEALANFISNLGK